MRNRERVRGPARRPVFHNSRSAERNGTKKVLFLNGGYITPLENRLARVFQMFRREDIFGTKSTNNVAGYGAGLN
ncbi:hypothetical protein GWI33_019774 [Rhynchophorus ferrugineus]|uniref:Uncharacterized protein n=1 Tax=Rhynchophorus ferrugineus TaxID=354439 RepID=A0A834M3Y8_RHYFE|nr:hypothetical protein GWI33_019774 [Rhynchophorus ferrugineus]